MAPVTFHLQLPDGRLIPLEAELTIGREVPGGLELSDPKVSRAHALVWRDGDTIYARDLGSSNGTFVSGTRISGPMRLKTNDEIRVGDTILRIVEPAAAPSKQPAAGRKRSGIPRWVWAACGVLAAGGAVCVVVAAVVALTTVFRSTGDEGTAPPEEAGTAEVFSFGDPLITALPADGSFGEDEYGVGAALSAGSLDAGGAAQLRRSELGTALQDELASDFEILSPAYSVAVDGGLDAAGTAQIRFPAPSPEARLAVILDDSYGGVLEILPTDGYLTVETHVGALGGAVRGPSDAAQSARRYFVVVPAGGEGATHETGSLAAPRPAPGAQPQLRRCDLIGGRICVTDGIVYVYHTDPRADLAAAVAAVEAIMAQYARMGLSAAGISAGNPVHIVVGSYRDPLYSSVTGNLYVNWAMIRGLASGEGKQRGDMAHELAHWIQDEEFVMYSAGVSGLDYWWIEVCAENAAFLIEPGAIEDNLFSYGRLQEAGDPRYALQRAPFTWSGRTDARYVQAIPVYVGLCDDPAICLFSQEGLVRAINDGTNPFTRGGMQTTYYGLLEDAARYLLGHPPASANSAIPIPAGLRTGNLANEFIQVQRTNGMSRLEPYFDSRRPQVQASDDLANIQAVIDRGGLYSFRVSNTGRSFGVEPAAAPGLPAYLEVQPGTPFLFTIDNGAPLVADSSRTTFIAPIHDTLGRSLVRLAAYAPDAAHTLQAEVGYVDLSGDWVTDGFQVTNYTDSCDEDPATFDWPRDIVLTFLAAYGHFARLEGAGDEIPYTWVQDQGFQEGDASMTIAASARVTMQDVQVEYAIHIPQPEQSRLFRGIVGSRPDVTADRPAETAALTVAAMALAALGLKPLRRKLALFACLAAVVAGLSLTGCEMITDFWGDITGRYVFRGLEYLSDDFSLIEEGEDLWLLSEGEGVMTLDLTTLVTSIEGEEEQRRCVANLTIATDGIVKLEDAVTPEEIFAE